MEIKVNTGLVDYDLGGKVTVSFNPTDMVFGQKMSDTIDELIAMHEAPMPEETNEILKEIIRRDKEARVLIDSLFDKEVCDPLYGTISVFAISDGFPLWANLLMALLEEMNTGADKAVKEMQKRIQKYTGKYRK